MKYKITNTYEVKEITCGEAIAAMATNDSSGYNEFIDPIYPDEVAQFHSSWSWVQARSPQKKLLLVLDEISSEGGFIDA